MIITEQHRNEYLFKFNECKHLNNLLEWGYNNLDFKLDKDIVLKYRELSTLKYNILVP